MLAKDVKIKTIARQAGFIKKQLRIINAIDGRDPQYIYMGHVYPEVKDEIKQQDENVSIHFKMRKGIPVTFFTLVNEQREFIEDKLAERAEAEDGNPMYVYPGYVPNEILEYFKSEGSITICEERVDENFPIVLFFPDDERLPLTSQERFMSTEFSQYDDSDDDEKIEKRESFVEWVKRKNEGDSNEES